MKTKSQIILKSLSETLHCCLFPLLACSLATCIPMAVEVKCQQGMYMGPITMKTIYLSGYIDFYIVSYTYQKI